MTKEQNSSAAPADAADLATTEPLEGEALKRAVYQLEEEVRAKIKERQHGVPTFSDNRLLQLIKHLRKLDPAVPWEESIRRLSSGVEKQLEAGLTQLRQLLSRKRQGRFVDYEARFRPSPGGPRSDCDVGYSEVIMSQGVLECMHWKGVPLFKTVYDFSLYSMMLWDIRPRTIIELGSGMGSSAIWMADLLRVFDIDGHIYSVDLRKPELQSPGVSFIQGDCMKIEAVFRQELLESMPHPWLFIEDAHINVYGVLCHFCPFFTAGDYLVIEDSSVKQKELGRFMALHPGSYKLDTRYIDFFGRNATCSLDSIFVKT